MPIATRTDAEISDSLDAAIDRARQAETELVRHGFLARTTGENPTHRVKHNVKDRTTDIDLTLATAALIGFTLEQVAMYRALATVRVIKGELLTEVAAEYADQVGCNPKTMQNMLNGCTAKYREGDFGIIAPVPQVRQGRRRGYERTYW